MGCVAGRTEVVPRRAVVGWFLPNNCAPACGAGGRGSPQAAARRDCRAVAWGEARTHRVRRRGAHAYLGTLVALLGAALVAGCAAPAATPAPRAEPQPTATPEPTPAMQPAPPAPAVPPAGEPVPTEPPAPHEPAPPPAGGDAGPTGDRPRGSEQPAPREPAPPPNLTVLERFDAGQPTAAEARPGPANRLVIDTRNVRRLRIDRAALPLRSEQVIILRLDGQPFEWLADSDVTEFERSVNGAWAPVRPAARIRPGVSKP